MRDLANKMAELKFEAPLAKFEETDEWGPVDYQSSNATLKAAITDALNLNLKENDNLYLLEEAIKGSCNNTNKDSNKNDEKQTLTDLKSDSLNCNNNLKDTMDNFAEAFTGSLEDLVNTFDEKITKCFGNYEQSLEELAPVQVRSVEDVMNESQMWWTITGNFGNILPIDWTKSHARQMHMPALQLNQRLAETPDDELNDLSSEDEAVANDLDMHALILGGLHTEDEPIKSAEEVIKEIDDIMDETSSDNEDAAEVSEVMEKAKEVLRSPLYEEKLQKMSTTQLNELYMEMEVLICEFSETLINELALRDELEYEKEMKNTFISLLLAVQNKRRQYHVEKKRNKTQGKTTPNGLEPKYLTTVIPYHLENGTPDNQALQVLIKILKAINEDSPTVPTLLTDYILKVLCPT
ncbi:fasciculation and elongation protein zeta-2 [Contarinia nasturtii]|uniref:fasciculation and elongation protein zeta-2 n=1 Tax=Contarinia nasturtii TaxID=265458 RepID=UPI0012D4561A|nr:fasciculation and elongation protein zeta-2 [Contarinia nasturtii]